MKKIILGIFAFFLVVNTNAEEGQKLKDAGGILCFGNERFLFEIKYYQAIPSIPHNCKEKCISFEANRNVKISNQIIDMQNLVTYYFVDKDGSQKTFAYIPNEGFSCSIKKN